MQRVHSGLKRLALQYPKYAHPANHDILDICISAKYVIFKPDKNNSGVRMSIYSHDGKAYEQTTQAYRHWSLRRWACGIPLHFLCFVALVTFGTDSFAQSGEARNETDAGEEGSRKSYACAVADPLFEAGMIEAALAAYIEVLNEDEIDTADKVCAVTALPKVRTQLVTNKLSKYESLVSLGNLSEAGTTLQAVLDIAPSDPDVQTAVDSFAHIASPGNDVIGRVRILASLGMHSKALEVLTEALSTAPEGVAPKIVVPADLEYLTGGKIPIWRDFRRVGLPWAVQAIKILAGLIVLVISIRLIRRRYNAAPVLQIREFGNGGFEAEHFGRYFSHSLLNRVESLSSGTNSSHVRLVDGPIDPIQVPSEVAAVIPPVEHSWLSPLAWAQAIPALLNWLFPRRVISLTGELHSKGTRGLGVTVRLIEKSRILVGYDFWEADFESSADASDSDVEELLYNLSEYVAVWLLFETARQFDNDPLDILGAKDWRSYALFRAGYLAEKEGRNVASQDLYIRALRREPALRAARVNLGLLYIREERSQEALDQLNQVCVEAETSAVKDRDPTYYSAMYNLAALKADYGDPTGALCDIKNLVKLIDETTQKIETGADGYNIQNLKKHMATLRPAANTMLGGLLVSAGDKSGLDIIKSEAARESLSANHQYNLSCAYVIVAKELSESHAGRAEIDKHLDLGVSHLKATLRIHPGAIKQAIKDPQLKFLWQDRPNSKEQMEELAAKLRVGSGSDAEENEDTTELPLAGLDVIGPAHANALAELEISSTELLLQHSLNAQDRKKLARALTISPRIVTIWAHAADLTRIIGVGIREANLLLMANVKSIDDLADSKAGHLEDDLSAIVVAAESEVVLTKNEISNWIHQAKTHTRSAVH